MMTWRIVVGILLVGSIGGVAKAQEAKGEMAERVKKEILRLEDEKAKALMSTSSDEPHAAEWLQRVDADDMAYVRPDGTMLTNTELIAQFRGGIHKTYSVKTFNQHVRVYGNGGDGTTAVVTYINESDGEHNHGSHGERYANRTMATDVFFKANGVWRYVLHDRSPVPAKSH